MELVIIALIAVEVVLVSSKIPRYATILTPSSQAFIRDGPELWEAAFGKPDHEHTTSSA